MKPRALDLFCCAGGATRGLQLVGFHVTGVDIKPQPNYVGDAFVQADVRSLKPIDLAPYDFVWASPPCQGRTAYRRRPNHVAPVDTDTAIGATRWLLRVAKVPHVIENVAGAPLDGAVMLCGSMFGLHVRRHRFFECSFSAWQPPCRHELQRGSFEPATNRANRQTVEIGVWRIPIEVQLAAMGIDWMSREELSQSIPPSYARWLGAIAMPKLTAPPPEET